MKYGSISTGSKEATLAAEEILKFGGNAFDAAVSAIFVSMTSEFALTGIFGGGTLLGIKDNKAPFIYDFFVNCPESKKKSEAEFKEVMVTSVKGYAMFLNLDQFKDIGFFDENIFFFLEEIDLCKRLTRKNKKIYLSETIKVYHEGGH